MEDSYIIFTDIDGTLYDKDSNCIPVTTKDTLQKLNNNGNKIFLCTGRTTPDIGEEYQELPIEGMIVGSGAQIIVNNETIYSNPISKNIIVYLLKYLKEHDIGFSLDGIDNNYLFGEALEVFRFFSYRNENNLHTYTASNADALLRKKHMFPFEEIKDHELSNVLKISIFTNNLKDLKSLINNLPSGLEGYIEKSEIVNWFSEITLKDNSKASGIKKLLEIMNLQNKNVIAIGDGINDIDMIKMADIGIAMGNGKEELKHEANHITESINNDGFKRAFEFYGLI